MSTNRSRSTLSLLRRLELSAQTAAVAPSTPMPLSSSSSTPSPVRHTALVNSLPALRDMLGDLAGATELTVDCEGVSLDRHGKLCLLALSPHPHTVFLVDVSSLGAAAFDTPGPEAAMTAASSSNSGGAGTGDATMTVTATTMAAAAAAATGVTGAAAAAATVTTGAAAAATATAIATGGGGMTVRDLLEDKSVLKLLYDVRCDSDALYHQYGVRLCGVLDLQMSWGNRCRLYGNVGADYLTGLSAALCEYLPVELKAEWDLTADRKLALRDMLNRNPLVRN